MQPSAITATRRSVLAGLASSAAAAAFGAPRLEAPAATVAALLDELIRDAMQKAPFPAVAVAIEHKGAVVYRKAFGRTDMENDVAAVPEAIFPIGSVTKTMTGFLVTQLAAAGKIDVEARVADYLRDIPEPAKSLQLKHLLNHSSGLVNYMDVPDFPATSQRAVTKQEVLSFFASRPLQFIPGTAYSYTNSGIYILGLILEEVTGQGYGDLLRERIFQPFGMTSSGCVPWETVLPRRAHGYLSGRGGFENAPRYDLTIPFAAGAVSSTVDDLLRYRRGVFGPQTSAELRRLLLRQERLPSGRLVPYSQGCLGIGSFEGQRRIFHPGAIFGFSSQYSYYPDADLTVALLTNVQNGRFPAISLEQKLTRAVLAHPRLVAGYAPLPASLGRELEGDYKVGDVRFGFDSLPFVLDGGKLALAPEGRGADGPKLHLLYQGDRTFLSPIDDEQRFHFARRGGRWTVVMNYYGGDFDAERN